MEIDASLLGLDTAYLDQNIIDHIRRGDELGIKQFLFNNSLTPVYSNETLKEIMRSASPSKYLEVLKNLGAAYLKAEYDESYKPTGRASIDNGNPDEDYENLKRTLSESPKGGDQPLTDFLQKLHGGKEDISFKQIFENLGDDLKDLLSSTELDEEDLKDLPKEERQKIIKALQMLRSDDFKNAINSISLKQVEIGQELDANSPINGSLVEEFEKATGLSPKTLSGGSITPPYVIEKIRIKMEEVEDSFDTGKLPNLGKGFFFKSIFMPHDRTFEELTREEQVTHLYTGLNQIGYYRDKKLRLDGKVDGLMSDLSHAGLASFCDVLLTMDLRLKMKAEACYEYTKTPVIILHIK